MHLANRLFVSRLLPLRNHLVVRPRAMSSAPTPKHLLILKYDFVENMQERRKPFRTDHLNKLKLFAEKGKLVMGGATGGDDVSGGLMIFKDMTKEEIEEVAKSDPYNVNGLVKRCEIIEYSVVEGSVKDEI